jgi:hypothetical protein
MNDSLVNSLAPLHAAAYGWALHCCNGANAEAADVLQNAYLKVIEGKAVWHERSHRDPAQAWLRGELDRAAPRAAGTPLRTQVQAFQVAQGLVPDGVAGPLTLIRLNRAAGIDEPRLDR